MKTVLLSCGSNIEPRLENIKKAFNFLASLSHSKPQYSKLYETEPLGLVSENLFINACVSIKTNLLPKELLSKILQFETNQGRVRNDAFITDRTCDIDILFYGNDVINEENLQIPHLRFSKRNFVLIPLLDIASYFIDPLSKLTISEIYMQCKDISEVYLFEHI